MEKIQKIYYYFMEYILNRTFVLWEFFGFHITRNYFESPIPDTRYLGDALWDKDSELPGLNINSQFMINILELFLNKYIQEYERFPRTKTCIPDQYYIKNGSFESVDAEIYYCMIRHFKPRKIIEIGAGNSTYLAAQAIKKNKEEFGNDTELIVIEPYPNKTLRKGFPGLSKLISIKLQDVNLSEFSKLDDNDILFIDSSHVLRIGSDVQLEYLELLPRLNKGVIVHIHDIFLPAEYKKEWIDSHRFLNEQYLLHAFLLFNDSFEVLWGGSFMHLKHPDKLEKAFHSYNRSNVWPGSFWMRKIK